MNLGSNDSLPNDGGTNVDCAKVVVPFLGMTSRVWRELKPNYEYGRERSLIIGCDIVMSLVLTKNLPSREEVGNTGM